MDLLRQHFVRRPLYLATIEGLLRDGHCPTSHTDIAGINLKLSRVLKVSPPGLLFDLLWLRLSPTGGFG